VDPGPEGHKAAFLSLEQVEKGQAKASVMEVFKKVPWIHLLRGMRLVLRGSDE